MPSPIPSLRGLWTSCAAALLSLSAFAGEEARVSYNRDVRPILSDRCFLCHGMDSAKRAAELRLDIAAEATKDRDGLRAVAPGSLEESEIWARINSADPDDHMPPAESNKPALDAREKEIIRRWIEQGAEYEPHWAFTPPARPTPPPGAARNPIDRFLDAHLAAQGLSAVPPADEERLVRRLFLDLTGLPPTPEELDAHMASSAPDRLDALAMKLMTEEPWRTRHAERMALPWLDAARYADTNGIHMDAGRTLWPWRDWVLDAYEANMPFDQFLVEQLAGDLLPGATIAQKVASGFNRNHVITDEGGAIDEEYLVEYAADRAATTASVFLGLTMNCARCHDHKFDPISQDEYYSFYAYFNSNEEPGLYSQLPDAKRAFEPFMEVPAPGQAELRAELGTRIEAAARALEQDDPDEARLREEWLASALGSSRWVEARVVSAKATDGVELEVQADDSVLAKGPNPDRSDYEVELSFAGAGLRLLALEAMADPAHGNRPGRAENGNAVVSRVVASVRPADQPDAWREIEFEWLWVDHEQVDGGYHAVNMLPGMGDEGWALGGHQREGSRVLVLLAKEPFGWDGGTVLRARIEQRTVHARHTLRQARLRVGAIDDAVVARLPLAKGGWHLVGPFDGTRADMYEKRIGPEDASTIDRAARFAEQGWSYRAEFVDGQVNATAGGSNIVYAARQVFAPSEREIEVSLGSDDGVQVYLGGKLVHENRVDRGAQPDQDKARILVPRGRHLLVFKIVNTGGAGGYYWRELPRADELAGHMVAALLPRAARDKALDATLADAWRTQHSPTWRAKREALETVRGELATLEASMPRTMVMRERETRRETYTLMRGRYDMPDMARKRERGIPAALGRLPEGSSADRLGLARWMSSAENPLVARVAVNRLWEQFFATGLVRTTEDFGLQGEYPLHPELLDWLAVEYRESGWNTRHMVRLITSSNAYRRSSNAEAELLERDPENVALAWFPRKRLPAEHIRDQALHVAGLLVEKQGGPSVKPYQPEGLWQEVAMLQSNTRVYERGAGDELWRRSLYTYWKRAAPPPSMLTFDAPTREFCNIRRTSTNTPLQALVLWNDEQFVEAARVLATRTLDEAGDDRARLARMFRRCAVRAPQPQELDKLEAALARFRARYAGAPEDAKSLVEVGEAPVAARHAAAELAAWTMVASSLLNIDATIVRS
jgi:hypothetical protein